MSIKFSLSPDPLFLVPDIKSLVVFANGDLGIGDMMKKDTIVKNVSKTTSDDNLEKFKTAAGFTLAKSNESYLKNGKYSVATTDIILNHGDDLSGLTALEKSLIQSIFESQKPYADVFIQTVGCLVKIEDIIARVLSVGGSSLKPVYNPKALGYITPNGTSGLNVALSQLDSLRNLSKSISTGTQSDSDISTPNTIQLPSMTSDPYYISGYEYDVLSTVYSTGEFDPLVNYNYEYIDILDDSIDDSDLATDGIDVTPIILDANKPKVVVFGIFDSKGNPLSSVPPWLQNSGKWFGQFDWVSDFKYTWQKSGNSDKIQVGSPGKGWNTQNDINGVPIATLGNGTNDINTIESYYNQLLADNLNALGLSASEQTSITTDINSVLSAGDGGDSLYKMQIDTLLQSGFLPTLQLSSGSVPFGKFPFLPKSISWSGTSSISATGSTVSNIWIDPENEYDMKVIKVSPTFQIKYLDKNNKLISGLIDTDPLSVLFSVLGKNQIGVLTDGYSPTIININQITNIQLSINTPYSTGIYGSCDGTNKQDIAKILRYATSINDTEDYYLIEGILQSENDGSQSFPLIDDGVNASGSHYYRFPSGPISAIGAFIRMLIDVFSKLIPSINTIEKILTNPASFIVNSILLKKIGDNNGTENIKFDVFSQGFGKDFSKLMTTPPPLRKEFVSNSKLHNYVYVDDNNNYRFLLDGIASVEFLSFLFGIELVNIAPKLETEKSGDSQPIMNFLLNLVTFPMKIIKGIIEFILNFFKSLSNPFSLPSKIVDFISFKWILDFFNPLTLLELLGITFDIITFGKWIATIDSYPDDHLFDLSEIISMPFVPKLFTATKEELKSLEKAPMEMLSAIICLIADIINAFIDFIWELMGLKPILDPPHVSLCKDTNTAIVNNMLSPQIENSGTQSMADQLSVSNTSQSSMYLYNITLSDGTHLTGLTYDQLQNYIGDHSSLDFDFEF